jgi:hypothetical protein
METTKQPIGTNVSSNSTPSEQTPFEPPPETISINEVAFMHQIIQACAQRGAFKPDEFKDVGILNDKLKAMLEYAKKLEEAAKTSDSASDPVPDPVSEPAP